jgi:UDPglucose 6-dehydrogenase
VKRPLVLDTRNIVDPDVLRRAGFSWSAVGRPPRMAETTGSTADA